MDLAIVATHPIQYQVPWYRALSAEPRVDLTVYFGVVPDAAQQSVGFGVPFVWDIPLLDGYRWTLLPNRARNPGLDRFASLSTPGIYAALRDRRPDAVIITGWHALPMLQTLAACMALGIPRIVRGEANAMRARPLWVRIAHKALLSRYQAFLAIGKSSQAFYSGYGISRDEIFMAPYCVDNARFGAQAATLKAERSAIRSSWGIPDDSTCFVFAGKLEEKKRVLDLLAALRIAVRHDPRVHVLIVGSGEQHDAARAFAEQHSLPVSFAGFLNQTEIAGAYVAADCLVLPSDFGETWGLVVNEAMACGRPALVSDRVGCWSDLVVEGETGHVFPFGDVHALGELMARYAGSADRLAVMGAAARAHVADYSIQRVVDGTIAALDSVLGST